MKEDLETEGQEWEKKQRQHDQLIKDYYNELEIKIPSFGFEAISTGNSEGEATTPIQVIPFEDSVTKGSFKVRLRTTETSFEGVSS